MRLRLHEIPEEGKSFIWNRETAELNVVLSDLIGGQDYEAKFFVKPMTSRDFELKGTIKTKLPEQCSRCGIDFPFAVNVQLLEILIPRQPEDRTGRYSRVNHLSEAVESGPSVSEYDADLTFDVGEYLHEQVAISVPFNPAPPEDEKGDCRLCGDNVKDRSFGYSDKIPEELEKPQSPFAALKNLKL